MDGKKTRRGVVAAAAVTVTVVVESKTNKTVIF
jgi:hypothetical protein